MKLLPISQWLLKNNSALDSEILDYSSVSAEWWPGLHDLQVAFSFEDQIIDGRAQGFQRNLALEKACAEALERLALINQKKTKTSLPRQGKLTSSGVAAHVTLEKAKVRARRELIERDILMCNTLTQCPFFELSGAEKNRCLTRGAHRFIAKLAAAGVEIKISALVSDTREHVVQCAAFGAGHDPKFGVNIGLGTSLSLAEAIEKSLFECFMMILVPLCGGDFKKLSLKQFLNLDKHSFLAHGQLGLHPETAAAYRLRYAEGTFRRPHPKRTLDHDLCDFTYERMPLPKGFEDCPIRVVRAQSAYLQPILVGPPRQHIIRRERLAEFIKAFSDLHLKIDRDALHVLC